MGVEPIQCHKATNPFMLFYTIFAITNRTNLLTFIPVGSTIMIADTPFLEYKRTSQLLLNKYKADCALTSDNTQSKMLLFQLMSELKTISEILIPYIEKDKETEAELNKYQIELKAQIEAIF